MLGGLAALYFAAGKFGLMLAFFHPSASPVWPPTGLALAAVLLLGYRVWPAVLVGAYLVNVTTAGSVATSIGIATGNTLEAVVGAYLVNRFASGRDAFDRPEDVFKWALLAAMISTLVSATFGVTTLCLGGVASWASYGPIWLTWWLGNAAGALIVAPLVLLWARNPRLRWNRKQFWEAALLLLAVCVIGLIVFGEVAPFQDRNPPLTFLCIPPVVWAAYRFGQREAVTASFLLSAFAVSATLRGVGAFAGDSPNESLLLLQAFMGVITVMAMTLAASVSERKRFEMQLTHLADHDSLTDLLSRRRFEAELWQHLAEAKRYGTRGSLLYLDLDEFKLINDRLGHETGDKLLVALAALLRGRLRTSDLLARVGGDEFAIALPHTGGDQAQALAEQLIEAIGSHPFQAAGRPVTITVSIGIALFPEDGVTVDELLAHADAAMYRAKRAGGNRFHAYAPDADRLDRSEMQPGAAGSVREALE
ncbi:MAG TPA: MASE1 domain-containing protein [Burkholderiales bacterium]|nr:MASE1 domain-containing protein [Burkholderiales bacterium]